MCFSLKPLLSDSEGDKKHNDVRQERVGIDLAVVEGECVRLTHGGGAPCSFTAVRHINVH